MDRKDFLRKAFLGIGMLATSSSNAKVINNEIDELKKLKIIGFNHLPNTQSNIMTNTILHKASTRGSANHGWLQAHHTFSFANYYNPERMHFGVLRVLNDDTIAGGMGFSKHPHDNMEIITIPLEGDLEHQDSMGNIGIIKNGDIQVMSAGSGLSHSEKNKNHNIALKLLQIWIFPKERNVTPRYDQLTLNLEDRHNKLQQILSPNTDDEGVWIHQDAWFHIGKFDKDIETAYQIKKEGNGLYVFVLNGEIDIENQNLEARDGFGIWDTKSVKIKANSTSEFLLMEVPMAV